MGLFDDLIPQQQQAPAAAPAPQQGGGLFDDLIPDATKAQAINIRPAGAPQEPPVALPVDPNTRQIMSGVQGAGRGLADIAGAPVDLVTAALNLGSSGVNSAIHGAHNLVGTPDATIPPIQQPFMGSDYIAGKASQGAEAVGLPQVTPETAKEKFAYNTNRLGTNAAATVGGLASLPAAVEGAAPQMVDTVSNIVKPYLAGTGRTIAGDVGAAAGGGALQTAGDLGIPDSVKHGAFGPLIDFALTTGGAVGGGTATQLAISTGKGVAGLVQKLLGMNLERDPNVPLNPATGKRYTKADVDQLAAILQDKAVNPEQAARNIGEGANYYAGEGGVTPTAGPLSGDVGLISLEKGARASNPVPFIQRDQQVNSAAVDKLGKIAPQGAEPEALPREVKRYADEQLNAADDKVAGAQSYVDRTQNVRSQHGQEVADFRGQGVPSSVRLDTQIMDQALGPMDRARRSRYEAVPNEPIEGGSETMHDAAQEVRAGAEDLPPNTRAGVLPAPQLGDFESYAIRDPDTGEITGFKPISYQTAENMRPELAAEINRQRKANASPRLLDNLEALRSTITDITNSHPAAAEANRFYNEDYAPVFGATSGEAGKFRKDVNKDRVNRSASPPSETAGRFLQPEAPEKTASLQRVLDSMPDPAKAQAAARDYLMSDMAESGALDRTGVIRPQAVRNWAQKNAANLDLVPGLRSDVEGIIRRAQKGEIVAGKFADELKAAQTNQKMTERQMNSGAFKAVIGADPTNAVSGIFKSNNPSKAMDDTLSAIKGNGDAIDGFKAAVRDYLQEKATTTAIGKTTDGSRPVSFAKLDNLFNEHEDTLSKLFSPAEMNSLRAAHKFLAPLQGLQTTAVNAGSTLARGETGEFSKVFRAGLIAHYGALKAGGIMKSLKLALESLPNNKSSLESLATQMFFDPKLAGHLLTRDVSSVNSPSWTKKLFTLMGVEAGARNEDGEK